MAHARRPARRRPPPSPTDPVELLSTPLGAVRADRGGDRCGGPGIRLGFYTVRDLLFHLPRRYDDLREMRKLGDLAGSRTATVVSARVTRRATSASSRRSGGGSSGRSPRLEDDTGTHRGDLVRAALHRAAAARRRRGRRVGQAQALRPAS